MSVSMLGAMVAVVIECDAAVRATLTSCAAGAERQAYDGSEALVVVSYTL
jgi:uncharacterized protein (DUF2147 family)